MSNELMDLAKVVELTLDEEKLINVCNSPIPGDNPGEIVFWVQYPFRKTGLKADLGKQYRITIREDEL